MKGFRGFVPFFWEYAIIHFARFQFWLKCKVLLITEFRLYKMILKQMTYLNFFSLLVLAILLSRCQNLQESGDDFDSIPSNFSASSKSILKEEESPPKLVREIALPIGYQRIDLDEDSFGEYLRNLVIKSNDNVVNLFDGRKKMNQGAHYCILDIDVGTTDLQQCADAVIRLRAEYLFKEKRFDEIVFNFTNGSPVSFEKYAEGNRVKVTENQVVWSKRSDVDYSYANFRKYLNLIFAYAGSYSLEKELNPVSSIKEIQPGDVLIQGGFPGHAVIVLDVAKNIENGNKIYLLAQSYMPAQEMHVLVNRHDTKNSSWYSSEFSDQIYTPEWHFTTLNLKRW